jgi:hypothetical protein
MMRRAFTRDPGPAAGPPAMTPQPGSRRAAPAARTAPVGHPSPGPRVGNAPGANLAGYGGTRRPGRPPHPGFIFPPMSAGERSSRRPMSPAGRQRPGLPVHGRVVAAETSTAHPALSRTSGSVPGGRCRRRPLTGGHEQTAGADWQMVGGAGPVCGGSLVLHTGGVAGRAAAVLRAGRPRCSPTRPLGDGARPSWRPSVRIRRERGQGVGRPAAGRSLRFTSGGRAGSRS